MSTELSNVLKQIEDLSFDELLTLQEQITRYLRVKGRASATQNNPEPIRRVKIPGAYRPTPEEIEASLARIFTPEELAEIGKQDFTKLPTGLKSVTEMLNEDREDRF